MAEVQHVHAKLSKAKLRSISAIKCYNFLRNHRNSAEVKGLRPAPAKLGPLVEARYKLLMIGMLRQNFAFHISMLKLTMLA